MIAAGSQPGAAGAHVTREPTRRLFFALWPDEALRAAFAHTGQKAARASGGRPVPAHNLHVTLLFLGSVAERRIPDLEVIAARVASSSHAAAVLPRQLVFDGVEHWEKPRILVATVSASHPVVDTLAAGLLKETRGAGFDPDLKSLFRPHVTLVRKVAHPIQTPDMGPVPWRFTEFVLAESRPGPDGPEYSVVGTFLLRTD
jgi:RNA 2',3'-cyclic 3'-phosphodiesterase